MLANRDVALACEELTLRARADADAGKALLGDRRIDDALRAELVEQPLAHLVGALVLRDLLAHEEHIRIAPHLLGHGVAQRLAHADARHFGAGRNLRRGRRLRAFRLRQVFLVDELGVQGLAGGILGIDGDKVEEFRVGGKLYMVRVTPPRANTWMATARHASRNASRPTGCP